MAERFQPVEDGPAITASRANLLIALLREELARIPKATNYQTELLVAADQSLEEASDTLDKFVGWRLNGLGGN